MDSYREPARVAAASGPEGRPAEGSVLAGLANLGALLRRHLLLVGGLTVAAAVLAVAGSFLAPRLYRAETTFLPSRQFDSAPASQSAGALLRTAQQFGMGLDLEASDPSPLFPRLVRSRRLAEALLDRSFPDRDGGQATLAERLSRGRHRAGRADLIERVRRRVLFTSQDARSGMTMIAATLPDPELAAAVANACVEELDRINREAMSAHAGRQVEFVGGRVQEVEGQLARAEDELSTFREANRSVAGSPALLLEQERLERQRTLAEQLYLALRQQLELARIDEVRNLPLITVIDAAVPPARPHSPRRLRLAAGAALLAFLLGLGIAQARERLAAGRKAA